MILVRLPTFAIRGRRKKRQARLKGIAGKVRYRGVSILTTWAAPVVLGLLLARAEIIGGIFPFGIAFWVAVKGKRPSQVLPVTLGVLLGAASMVEMDLLVRSFVAIMAVQVFLNWKNTARFRTPGALSSLAFAVVLGAQIPWLALPGFGVSALLNSGFEALIAGLGCLMMIEGMPFLERLSSSTKVKGSLGFGAQLGAATLAAVAFVGLKGIMVGPFSLQGCLSHLLVLTFSLWGSAGLGAATGVAVGALAVLGGSQGLEAVAFYALPGLLGGTLRAWGKTASLMGYVSGVVLMGFTLDARSLSALLLESLIAMTVILVTPADWWKKAVRVVPDPTVPEDKTAMELTSDKLEELATAFSEVSTTFQETSPCSWEDEDLSLPHLFSGIVTRVCGSCSKYRQCWERDYYATYGELLEVFSQSDSSGRPNPDRVPASLRARCGHVDKLLESAGDLCEFHKLNKYWQRRLTESRELICSQLTGITKILHNLASDLKAGQLPSSSKVSSDRFLAYEVGVARKPTDGQVSGDQYLARELDGERLLLVLSDGMGIGSRASMESQATVALLEKLLASGFDKDSALKTVNSILLLRSPEEIFATVDMALVNLTSGCADFLKVGGAPSFLLRQGSVKMVKAQGLPLGILGDVVVEPSSEILLPGDTLIMATDGLVEAGSSQGDKWITQFLEECPEMEAADLAETMVRVAVRKRDSARVDDITVLVTRFLAEA